jgi:hypothetical protein
LFSFHFYCVACVVDLQYWCQAINSQIRVEFTLSTVAHYHPFVELRFCSIKVVVLSGGDYVSLFWKIFLQVLVLELGRTLALGLRIDEDF